MSTFGTIYRTTTFGESHCKSVGVIIDGFPPGLPVNEQAIQAQLDRRRPGQSNLTTPRNEADIVTILSGVEMGYSLGTPIAMMVNNKDQKPHDYGEMDYFPRPSHADYTYLQKYGVKASSGGGRSSARETIGRVCSGKLAEIYLDTKQVEIVAFVSSVGNISVNPTRIEFSDTPEWKGQWEKYWAFLKTITRQDVDANPVRCPNTEIAEKMVERIIQAKEDSNSIGGTITCVIRNCPIGLGEPCFDKMEAMLAHAMLSIPATKGFEIGSGFSGTCIPGHIHNDPFVKRSDGLLGTSSNFSGIEGFTLGGIQGGISNGEDIYFNVAFKSVATIGKAQSGTATYFGEEGTLEAKGRHDPCVLPRAVPIVEAMAALVVADLLMIQDSRKASTRIHVSVPAVLKGELGKGN